MVAEKSSPEAAMEARIARLESDVAHLRTDVAEIKVDIRALRDKVDGVGSQLYARIDSSVGELRVACMPKFDNIDAKFERMFGSMAKAQVWALMLYVALAVATFGTMARGFGWL